MLNYKKLEANSPDFVQVNKLYEQAFPANERSYLELLIEDLTGSSEVYCFYAESEFVGFVALLNNQDISHILYFAIEEATRGKGYGTEVLQLLPKIKPNCRILADLEAQNPKSTNNMQRIKRKQFYLNNGYISSEVKYNWRDEDYEILVYGGTLGEQEFWNFWERSCALNPIFEWF